MRVVSTDLAVAMGPAPIFEESEPIMEERMKPTEEATSILQKKTSAPKSLVADKRKGQEIDALKKSEEVHPFDETEGIVIGSSTTLVVPAPVLEKGGSNFEMMSTTHCLLVYQGLR